MNVRTSPSVVQRVLSQRLAKNFLPEQPGTPEDVDGAGQLAASLVTEMLDVLQFRAGKVTLDRKRIDLSSLLAQVVQDQALLTGAKKIQLEGDLEQGLVVNVDPIKLKEVAVNLLGNAIKFTPNKGWILVVLRRSTEGHSVFSVSDSGPGLPVEHRAGIFDPWELGPAKASSKGYGLGLAICRMIVKAHGGTITVDTAPIGGARFEVSLPGE